MYLIFLGARSQNHELETLCLKCVSSMQLFFCTSGCPWPSDTMKLSGSPSMSWNHVPKKFQVLDHVKPPMWNPGFKIEIPHLENRVLKVFRFRSWKPRVWKSKPQSWNPKSWGIMPSFIIILILKGEKLVNFDAVQRPQATALSALGPLISGVPQP